MNILVDNMFQELGLEKKMDFKYLPRKELLAQSDFISVHCPSNAQTKGMLNRQFLRQMREDAVLLNTSRGALMNEEDILEHLEENPEFWVGTDVFNDEPQGN